MARKYDVHGTKDFMVWAIILAGLGLWCVKDGWFPSESVLERHPRQVQITAEAPGMITEVYISKDQAVADGQVVAKLATAGTNAPVALKTTVKGEVSEVSVKRNQDVKGGDPIALIVPHDSFYAFNKSTAFLSLLGAAICGFIHRSIR